MAINTDHSTATDEQKTASSIATLRKINLNVDLATQAELISVYNDLTSQIQDISTETLTSYYTKTEVNTISSALSNQVTADIAAEATAREEADNAIKASLSAYALSTTVADAYKVTVSDADEQTSSFVYTIKQGELTAGTINVPKDMFVEGASFKGTVLVLSVRGQDTPISTDLSGLVDVYTGGSTTDAVVSVDKDTNVITVTATEAIARVGTSEDASSANTIYGAKKSADEVAAAVAVSAEGETGDGALVSADDANNMITVGSTQKLKDAVAAAETAIQSVAGDNTYLTASTTDNAVTVSATDKLTSVVNVVETTSANWNAAETNAKAYTDTVSAALSTAFNTEIGAEKTRAEGVEQALSGAIDNLSSSLNAAEGDDYISAYVDGNTVKVEALCATVWNEVSAKADLTAVDGLSAIYKTIAKVNNAVSSTRFDLPITDDYEDIDDIIADVIEIRKALNMLRETAGGGGGDELPTGYDFYGIAELPAAGASERALYGVTSDAGQYTVALLKSKATDATFADTDAAFEPSDPTNGIIAVTHNGYSTGYSLVDDGEGGYYLSRWSGESENQSHATFTEVTVDAAETFYNS